jgi:hypothetical protein
MAAVQGLKMRLKGYLVLLLTAICLLIFPRLVVTDNELLSNILSGLTFIGILLSPGISFAMFLKRWTKNVSDDMVFASAFFFSILWIGLTSYVSFSQGIPFNHVEILYWILIASLVLAILSVPPKSISGAPNGGEPFVNKLPAIVLILVLGVSGIVSYSNSSARGIEVNNDALDYSIAIEEQTENSTMVRINNPSDSPMRVTLYFIDTLSAENSEIYTNVLRSGESFVNLSLPYSSKECRQYQLVYYSSLEDIEVGKDIFLNSYGCSARANPEPRGALPKTKSKLLQYIYRVGAN